MSVFCNTCGSNAGTTGRGQGDEAEGQSDKRRADKLRSPNESRGGCSPSLSTCSAPTADAIASARAAALFGSVSSTSCGAMQAQLSPLHADSEWSCRSLVPRGRQHGSPSCPPRNARQGVRGALWPWPKQKRAGRARVLCVRLGRRRKGKRGRRARAGAAGRLPTTERRARATWSPVALAKTKEGGEGPRAVREARGPQERQDGPLRQGRRSWPTCPPWNAKQGVRGAMWPWPKQRRLGEGPHAVHEAWARQERQEGLPYYDYDSTVEEGENGKNAVLHIT